MVCKQTQRGLTAQSKRTADKCESVDGQLTRHVSLIHKQRLHTLDWTSFASKNTMKQLEQFCLETVCPPVTAMVPFERNCIWRRL